MEDNDTPPRPLCPRRVEIEREQRRARTPRGADDDDDEAAAEEDIVIVDDASFEKCCKRKRQSSSILGDVVWSVSISKVVEKAATGVQRELEDCENRNRSEPNFSGKVRGVWVPTLMVFKDGEP